MKRYVMNTQPKQEFDFVYDVLDKRVTQISTKELTASDRLIYARMFNEFRLWKDTPGGYTPSQTMLAVVGCYSDTKPVRAAMKRLEAIGLIERLPTKDRQPVRYLVRTIDEALKVNPLLLSQPTMQERRATGMQPEKKGYRVTKKTTVLKTPDNGSQDCRTTVLTTVDNGSQDLHEKTLNNNKDLLNKQEEGQKQGASLITGCDEEVIAEEQICKEVQEQASDKESGESPYPSTWIKPEDEDNTPLDDDADDYDDSYDWEDDEQPTRKRFKAVAVGVL